VPDARATDGPPRPLSARETEIVGWLREGKSNEEMARILGISALTVKNHLQRIYRLLGVGNCARALARCLELRLLED
jgi:DNA-binding CsgD family transcriptional regulator